MKVKVQKLHHEAIIPQYAKNGDACFDLCTIDAAILQPGERKLFKTGLAFEVPRNYELQVRPRSGLALKHGISVVNTPGTVDSNYRGDVGIILINHGTEPFEVKKFDRIAQAVVKYVEPCYFEVVDELSKTERGGDGFGSTGRKGGGNNGE